MQGRAVSGRARAIVAGRANCGFQGAKPWGRKNGGE